MEQDSKTNKTVLLVDDDQFLRDMYALKFRERGFTVETSEGGSDALERLRGGLAPSIVLFDIVMPGLDGFEFLTRLKEEKLAEGAVTIALSNEGQGADVEKATSLGARGYIIKANTIPSEVVDKVIALAGN
jgi:two-component system CheB/CheR fusion protein